MPTLLLTEKCTQKHDYASAGTHLPNHLLTGDFCSIVGLNTNLRVAVCVGYVVLFGISVETDVVMILYLHDGLECNQSASFQKLVLGVFRWARVANQKTPAATADSRCDA